MTKAANTDALLIDRRRLIAAGAGLGAITLTGPAYALSPAGLVQRLQGSAMAKRAEEQRTLAANAEIFVNDTVSTGADSRLVLQLGVTEIRLGAAARMRIDRFLAKRGGVIDLEAGPMLFDRPDDAPKTDIEFRSVFAVVAVRGTRFFAGPSNGVFGVFVERGALQVRAAGKSVTLGAGQGTNVARPGKPQATLRPGKRRASNGRLLRFTEPSA